MEILNNIQNNRTILGVDIGLANTGWTYLSTDFQLENDEQTNYFSGMITSKITDKQRLVKYENKVQHVIYEFKPDVIAIEKFFSSIKNKTTIVKTAQALAFWEKSASILDIPIYFYTPQQAKRVMTGNTKADKKTMILNCEQRFPKDDFKYNEHTADSFGIALCQFNSDIFKTII